MSADVSIVIINKNEPAVVDTLDALAALDTELDVEIVVVDASRHRFDAVRDARPEVTWIDFEPIPGVVTIPHQRNAGVRAATAPVVVFVDATCGAEKGWLDTLVAPILAGEEAVCSGPVLGVGRGSLWPDPAEKPYLDECATANLAFRRELALGEHAFDETFAYGSDVDFSWRLRARGIRVRNVRDAVMTHDFGDEKRQLKRAFQYGEARARLYAKHPDRLGRGLRDDPVVFAYPAFLLALPFTLHRRLRWLPLLALVPLYRNRDRRPFLTLADHLAYGAGALRFVADRLRGRR